ncbi:NusG domain II-containing protein [bacterium]|nr:NusG domain II-containing protein [bacterium]
MSLNAVKSFFYFFRTRCTPADRILLFAAFLITCLSLALLKGWGAEGRVAQVEVEGRPYARLYLSEPRRLSIPAKLGELVLVVQDRRVHIEASRCPQQICVHSGAIGRSGELLVCVPNRVVVRISGETENPLDLITQ